MNWLNQKTVRRIMKRIGITLAAVLVIVAVVLAYQYDQPGTVPPIPILFKFANDWEMSVRKPDVQHEHLFIQSGDVLLEADLVIPVGGKTKKGAVIFSQGSGAITYEAYFGITQKYVQDVFLPRDMAVLYFNKPGIGGSQGNWKHQDFQGRADDLYAAVKFLKDCESIDPDKIGLIGHSQGGYIVPITASQHEDVAFLITLAGPTTTVWEQMKDTYEIGYRCQGYRNGELKRKLESAMKWSRWEADLGRIVPLGEARFQAGIIDYDPAEALKMVKKPALLVFAENDSMVPSDKNLARFNVIFEGNPPFNMKTATISGANHIFRLTDRCAASAEELSSAAFSEQLVQVLQDWLTEQGY